MAKFFGSAFFKAIFLKGRAVSSGADKGARRRRASVITRLFKPLRPFYFLTFLTPLCLFLFVCYLTHVISHQAHAQERSQSHSEKVDQVKCQHAKDLGIDCATYNKRVAEYLSSENEAATKHSVSSHRYMLDNSEYYAHELISAFITIAFPKYAWFEDPLAGVIHSKPTEAWLRQYPEWLHEFVVRSKGYPQFDGLNRWANEITIGLGWPPPNPIVRRHRNYPYAMDTETASKLTTFVKKAIPHLEKTSGIRIRFIPPSAEDERHFARVRIVTSSLFFNDNIFKANRAKPSEFTHADKSIPVLSNYSFLMTDIERLYRDAVRFTPYSRSQVEGYFLTDSNNIIQFAACQMWPISDDKLLQSLVNECLVRSLGLPEMISTNRDALTGHWNNAYDDYSKRLVIDGDAVNTDALSGLIRQLHDNSFEKLDETKPQHSAMPFPDNASKPSLHRILEFDKAMISLLYCSKMRPGMSRHQAIEILLESEECFSSLPPKGKPQWAQ